VVGSVEIGRVIKRASVGCTGFVEFPVRGRNETFVADSFRNAEALSDFHNVQFSRRGPSNLGKVVAHGPKGWPEPGDHIRSGNIGLHDSVLERELVFGFDACRRKASTAFALYRNQQVAVPDDGVFFAVGLEFTVAPSTGTQIVRPNVGIETIAIEFFTPDGSLSGDDTYRNSGTHQRDDGPGMHLDRNFEFETIGRGSGDT
jgi:hypothetical protein